MITMMMIQSHEDTGIGMKSITIVNGVMSTIDPECLLRHSITSAKDLVMSMIELEGHLMTTTELNLMWDMNPPDPYPITTGKSLHRSIIISGFKIKK